ncbi:TniQ family protein [Variovorax sp. J2P1-59]|uniref:TniQ family protein n=1 Tax=Variovorax flavidus TaxID=3053501 RepID=UPI002575DC38|nr:TniQ family protein [Variovorax sp. J2P1-59]MDM0075745.1 TniQ family protein [Variovorax sp. J2P1-59]
MSEASSYLVRVRPKAEQSLSSWRQDAAVANGYELYPVPRGALRRVDPDAGGNAAELEWLARTHRMTLEEIEPLTLRAFEGKVFRYASVRCHPTWLLRTRYTRESPIPGPQYCPHCLAQSGGGYFRTVWRLGFVTVCPIHLCELLDRCPACGAGVWPVGATVPRLFEVDHPSDYLHCARCGFQLSRAPADLAPEAEDTARWITSLIAGMQQDLTPNLQVESVDYLQALDAICHLCIRNRPRAQILASSTDWADAVRSLVLEPGTNQVELLRIEDRRKLIHLARPMLSNWPDAFVDFARQTGLSQEHFSGSEHLMPGWMRTAVYEKLRKQKRLSVQVVSAEIKAMRSAGLEVTKQALRERLGSDAKAIDVLLPCRLKANRWELARFARRTTSKRQRFRRRQTVALVRSRLHLVLAALSGKTLEAVASMTVREVQEFVDLRIEWASATERYLAESMRKHWERLSTRTETWGDPSCPFRTSSNTDPARFARQTLLKTMSGMKSDLRRDISVFWRRGRAASGLELCHRR